MVKIFENEIELKKKRKKKKCKGNKSIYDQKYSNTNPSPNIKIITL